jgi:UDP-N-acetylglucosamine 1-carboxyvinyltransferase
MDQLWITGGKPLSGSVDISGAKNATLPILAACLLASEPVTLANMPHLKDVTAMLELLGELGLRCRLHQNREVTVYLEPPIHTKASYELTYKTRASILLLGPLLTRWGKATLGLPGGCMIGHRPINLHIAGLEAMGAQIRVNNNYIEAFCANGLKGATIVLELVSVTSTQNLMMAATLAKGTTIIRNAACEPEVVDLACFLNTLGAHIQGAGTQTIIIEGVLKLGGGKHTILPDRLEAATLLIAAVCTQGAITVNCISPHLLENVLDKLEIAGAVISRAEQQIALKMETTTVQPIDIQTSPYPGFPTDIQAHIMALNTTSSGVSKITETIFENRFLHVPELRRMGADIKIIGRTAICTGVPHLFGACVMANDLRGCASLVLAALMAKGDTVIKQANYTDRGYEYFEEKFLKLGANIQWVESAEYKRDLP